MLFDWQYVVEVRCGRRQNRKGEWVDAWVPYGVETSVAQAEREVLRLRIAEGLTVRVRPRLA